MRFLLFVVLLIISCCCEAQSPLVRLKELSQPFGESQPGSWQYEQNELGQTFLQYKKSRPTVATAKRSIIYIQTIGTLTPNQQKIVEKTAQYLGIYYGLKTKILPPLQTSVIPISARRIHPLGQRQFNATYICEKVLIPRCPQDAAAYIAFTADDLFPAPDWNFCFGMALYKERVGVWSIARNGNPDNPDEAKTVLRRTICTASHEVGHMFSMKHCIAYKCCMNGVNSLEEADQTPLHLCPECIQKLKLATKVNYIKRYEQLEQFYSDNSLEEEVQFIQKLLEKK